MSVTTTIDMFYVCSRVRCVKLRFKDNIKEELCKLEFYRPLINYIWNI